MNEKFTPEDTANLLEVLKAVRTAAEHLSKENIENTCDDPTELFDAVTETAVQLRKLLTEMASETRQYFMRELELTPEWLTQPPVWCLPRFTAEEQRLIDNWDTADPAEKARFAAKRRAEAAARLAAND